MVDKLLSYIAMVQRERERERDKRDKQKYLRMPEGSNYLLLLCYLKILLPYYLKIFFLAINYYLARKKESKYFSFKI